MPIEFVEFDGIYRNEVTSLIDDQKDTILQYVTMHFSGDHVLCFACDEMGLLKNLPHNFFTVTETPNNRYFEDIVGTVIFLTFHNENVWEKEVWDFKLEDLTEDDIDLISYILSDQAQEISQNVLRNDPHIRKAPDIATNPFKPTEDFTPPLPHLLPTPVLAIPAYMFTKWSFGQEFTFYIDEKGTEEFVTGVKKNAESGTNQVYCENTSIAKSISFTVKPDNAIKTYVEALYQLDIPSIVYVDAEFHRTLSEFLFG